MRKIGVVGVGAIGGWVAARLALAGHAVACLARAETLTRLRGDGLTLVTPEAGASVVRVTADDDAARLGVQDVVVIAVKGASLLAAAESMQPMIGPDTLLLPMMNGVPWWFLLQSPPLASLDPEGLLDRLLPFPQVLGSVVHATCTSPEPGVIHANRVDKLVVGEPAAAASARVDTLVTLLDEAGLRAVATNDVRADIWYKLWGNMTMNPISALTRGTTADILDDELVAALTLAVMKEAATIGARIGCEIHERGEARMAVTRKLGAFRTSMLQDMEAGKPLELEALLGAPREIARRHGIPTPYADALHGLVRLAAARRKSP